MNAQWPTADDSHAWQELANRAMQEQTLAADLQESAEWETTIRALVAANLPYDEFQQQRFLALRERTRRRKLKAQNIRYAFGFRHRPRYLVRQAIRAHFGEPPA